MSSPDWQMTLWEWRPKNSPAAPHGPPGCSGEPWWSQPDWFQNHLTGAGVKKAGWFQNPSSLLPGWFGPGEGRSREVLGRSWGSAYGERCFVCAGDCPLWQTQQQVWPWQGVKEALWPSPLARLCLPCRLGGGLFWLSVARLFLPIDLVEMLRGAGGRDCIILFL